MRKNRDWERAKKLEDMIPLFEPHRFWDDQPVPKSVDALRLDDDAYNKAIENKTVDQISEDPYNLPAQYQWCDINLNDDEVAEEVYQLLM